MNFWQVNVLLEKDLLEKSSTIKIFQYTPLNKKIKIKKWHLVKLQFQGLDKVYKFYKMQMIEE